MVSCLSLVLLALSASIALHSCVAEEGSSGLHPVSVVEADIYVTKFKATVRLKAFAEDLELLQGVEALDDGFYDNEEIEDAIQDHAEFLSERIELILSDGKKAPAKIVDVVPFEIPEEGIRQGTLMNYAMSFALEYAFDEAPEFITINQRMVGEGMILPSELRILLKQSGSNQPYMHMMKPDKPETFRFDWDNPVLNSDASEEDWEKWFEDQRQKTLGIQSYSSVYSFIYIENYEVRHEVLIPLATLATLFEMERVDPGFLEIAEQDVAAEQIKEIFGTGNPVEIDGVEVQPVFDRIDFYGLDLRDFAMQAERRKVSMANGRAGIIMSYSTKGMPQDVKVTWDKFSDSVKSVDSIIFAFEKIEKTEFTMFLKDNTYEWTAADREPPAPIVMVRADADRYAPKIMQVSKVAGGFAFLGVLMGLGFVFSSNYWRVFGLLMLAMIVGTVATLDVQTEPVVNPFAHVHEIEDDHAEQVFAQLHKNIFRAFDYPNENEIYDALAKSVDGDLLKDMYIEIIESLKVREQGGAVSRINEVNLVDGQRLNEELELPLDRAGFGFQSQWDLVGTVEHWGHIHERTNRYDARFVVELVDQRWKITEFEVVDQQQGTVKTDLRKF